MSIQVYRSFIKRSAPPPLGPPPARPRAPAGPRRQSSRGRIEASCPPGLPRAILATHRDGESRRARAPPPPPGPRPAAPRAPPADPAAPIQQGSNRGRLPPRPPQSDHGHSPRWGIRAGEGERRSAPPPPGQPPGPPRRRRPAGLASTKTRATARTSTQGPAYGSIVPSISYRQRWGRGWGGLPPRPAGHKPLHRPRSPPPVNKGAGRHPNARHRPCEPAYGDARIISEAQ